MERLEVKGMNELATKMSGWLASLDDYPSIGVLGFYDDIRQLMQELVILGHDINAAELEYYGIDNYDKEFLLYLTEDGIAVEKAWNDEFNGYYFVEGDVVAVIDNCSSAVLKSINADIVLEVGVTDAEEDAPIQDEDNAHKVHTEACIVNRDNSSNSGNSGNSDRIKAEIKDILKNIEKPDADENEGTYAFSCTHYYDDDKYRTYSCYSSDKVPVTEIERMVKLLY